MANLKYYNETNSEWETLVIGKQGPSGIANATAPVTYDGGTQTVGLTDSFIGQTVRTFANASARNTAIPSPTEGMVTYLEDSNIFQYYNGSWISSRYFEKVQINTTRTDEKLTIEGPGGAETVARLNITEATANSRPYISFARAGGVVASITGTNSAIAYNTTSDYRLKENVSGITGALGKIESLNPVEFNFIVEPDQKVDGFLAHELQEVIPYAVHGSKDETNDNGDAVYQGVDYSKIVPILTAAIKELSARVELLEAEKE
jgi:hypothetical protein